MISYVSSNSLPPSPSGASAEFLELANYNLDAGLTEEVNQPVQPAQPANPVQPYVSMESSLRNRVFRLSQEHCVFLGDKGGNVYWTEIKDELRKFALLYPTSTFRNLISRTGISKSSNQNIGSMKSLHEYWSKIHP